MVDKQQAVLRVQIPFCVNPCDWQPHCAIIPGWNSKRQRAYMQAVIAEITSNAEQFNDVEITAVRLGGGLAACVGEDIANVMNCIRKSFSLADAAPVTMRTALSNISGANMTWFKRAGITRYDLEMMSLVEQNFYLLNKNDSLKDYQVAIDYILRSYANKILGIYLAWGLAAQSDTQTVQNFRNSIMTVVRSHAIHLVLLPYEGGTGATDEQRQEMLAQARELLADGEFTEYLPLHFARPGHEDRYFKAHHNGAAELAFGLGAQTRFDGAVSTNTSDLTSYLKYSSDYSRITVAARPLIEPQAKTQSL
jgi:oxygen-independent coproporphyrinogen-3 oxidase